MKFIVETPATHPGIKLYICRKPHPSRGIELRGERDAALRFPTNLDADIARRRMSSLYRLIITQVKD